MRALHVAAVLAICAVMCACASPAATRSSVGADYRLDPTGTKGLVVGSITYDTGLGVYSIAWTPSAGGPGYVASVGWALWPPLGPEYDDDLKAKGGTFAVEVPSGDYTLQKWSQRAGYIVYSAERPIGLTFSVKPGEVTYLGNFHFHKSDEVSLEDRSSRDIPILKARFGAVKAADVGMSLANGFSLQAIGGATQRRMEAPAYMPIVIPVKR